MNVECRDKIKLQQIFQKRINFAKRSNSEIPKISLVKVRSLIKSYGDNIRAMEEVLYDWIQEMRELQDV